MNQDYVDDGRIGFGFRASADRLSGLTIGLDLKIDAKRLIAAAPRAWGHVMTTVSNPRINPLAPVGEWLSRKLFEW